MPAYTRNRDIILPAQYRNKFYQRIPLAARDILTVKIAYQADLDLIGPVHLGLRPPTPAHFDLSVGRALAVADNKMIKKPTHPSCPVIPVKYPGVASQSSAVMHGDRAPPGIMMDRPDQVFYLRARER